MRPTTYVNADTLTYDIAGYLDQLPDTYAKPGFDHGLCWVEVSTKRFGQWAWAVVNVSHGLEVYPNPQWGSPADRTAVEQLLLDGGFLA